MTFREIFHGSEAYSRECELRQEVLRRPLGLNLYDEDLSAEAAQVHFGLFDADILVACIVATPMPCGEVMLRQMAVSPRVQRRGYGRRLLELLEEELLSRGYGMASLHAKASAVNFYAKLGFQSVGSEFLEVGIPHLKMSKRLTNRSVERQDGDDAKSFSPFSRPSQGNPAS